MIEFKGVSKVYDNNVKKEQEKLQEENAGYMVFVKCGIFFDVIGKDAVVLHELCGFAPICIKENTCKCGVPVKTFDKFLKKFINEHKFALVVYDYNKNNNEQYKEIVRIEGRKTNEKRECLNCDECWYSKNRIIKNIEVAEAILKACTDLEVKDE